MTQETPAATAIGGVPPGYVEYEIDVEKILRTDLPIVLANVPPANLTSEAISRIPERAKGAYVLYENSNPVYAGKTDTRHGFRSRLAKHYSTLRHRRNLDPDTIDFKAVRILVFSNFDVEAILINELRGHDPTALSWNDSGFGSNDPGRNREGQEPARWDVAHPIDIDQPLNFMIRGRHSVLEVLRMLKAGLPYDFRYQTDLDENGRPRKASIGHVDQRNGPEIDLAAESTFTLRSLLRSILEALPKGWRGTVFPGRIILYQESYQYPHAVEYLER